MPSTDSYTEVTLVPSYPSLQLCCQVSRKTSSYAFVLIRCFCCQAERGEPVVKGRRQHTGLASSALVNCKKFPGN